MCNSQKICCLVSLVPINATRRNLTLSKGLKLEEEIRGVSADDLKGLHNIQNEHRVIYREIFLLLCVLIAAALEKSVVQQTAWLFSTLLNPVK